MQKFTLPAGTTNRHKWHKDAAAAVQGVTRTFDMVREKYGTIGGDERESLVTVFSFGVDEPKNPEAVAIYEALGERFRWAITRDNAGEIAEAFSEALPKCMETVPLDDHRTTPEQDAERAEAMAQDQQEREVKAAAKADTVEQLAAELRKQYPDAIGRDSGKSSHARASANLKLILQAQGLRVSVKSSSFSMGDSVTAKVMTPDLPPERRKEIDAIAERFTYGTFDPMTDSSGYDHTDAGEAWEAVHGRAKYCRAEYARSDENRAAAVEFLGGDEFRRNCEPGGSESHQLWSGAHCRAAEFWAKWAEDHKPDEPEAPAQGGAYRIDKHHHTKRGFDFWLVLLADRVERDEYLRLRSSCKAAGGWYSRKWGTTPGGFAFKEREQAGAWAVQEFGGDDTPPDPETKRDRDRAHEWLPVGTSKKGPAKAAKFREMAEKLDAEVMAKRGDHQENTPKRQREAMSRRIDADRLERTAQALQALAGLYEAGEVPEALAKFTSKKAVYEALGTRTSSQGYYHIGDTHEPTDESPEAAALWALIDGKSDKDKAADVIKEKVAAVKFSKIPGYFPTPPDLVAEMLDRAQVGTGHAVLEPSAGDGAIVDALADLHADPLIVVNEINPTLCEILQAKGYDARPVDFLETNGEFRYDRVVMNPPFEKLQDIDHVRHAFDRLKAGGRLVSIMSPGPFFRDTAKAREFRQWFEDLGGEVETLEAGSFLDSGTGVESRLVVIDKPEGMTLQDLDEVLSEPKATPQVEPLEGMTPLGVKPKPEAPAFEISEQPSLF